MAILNPELADQLGLRNVGDEAFLVVLEVLDDGSVEVESDTEDVQEMRPVEIPSPADLV